MRAAVGLMANPLGLVDAIKRLSPYVYYRLDEASTLVDSSGNGRASMTTSGTVTRTVTLRNTIKGITLANAATLTGGAAPTGVASVGYSMFAVLLINTKPTGSPWRSRFFEWNSDWQGLQIGWGSSSSNTGKPNTFQATINGSTYVNVNGATDMGTSSAHDLCSTWDKITLRGYVDGSEFGNTAATVLNGDPGSLVCRCENGANLTVGHVAYWQRALTATEVAGLHSALLRA